MRPGSAVAVIAAGFAAALLTSACPIESPYLEEIGAQIYRDEVGLPDDPTGLNATALDPDRIDLSWSDNTDVEEAYEVQRKRTAVGRFESIATLPPDATSYRDTGLHSQTTYHYQVRAVNAGGASVWLQADATTHRLASPTGLVVAALDEARIDVAWSDASEYEEGFELQRAAGPGAGWIPVYPALPPGTESVAETALESGTGYAYRVRAVDGGGASAWSAEAAAITAYSIGDTGPAGGTVFFDDALDGADDYPGWRYMEVAPQSTEWFGADWGNNERYLPSPIPPSLYSGIGYGYTATSLLDGNLNASYAVSMCFDLTTAAPHEYGVAVPAEGWHMPSIEELYALYVFSRAYNLQIGLDTVSYYYSTTEDSDSVSLVHAVHMGAEPADAKTFAMKNPMIPLYATRAVRYFDWQPPGTPP